MKNKTRPAKDVNEYLEACSPLVRKTLGSLRRTIRDAAPDAEEVISYRIPTYKLRGTLIHFMALKERCSLITTSYSVIGSVKHKITGYQVSGTTIHFTPENPLPATLIKRIVKLRIKENKGIKK